MLDLSGWLKALELPTRALLGIFISALALILAESYGILSLVPLWVHSGTILKIIAIVSGCLLLAAGSAFLVEEKIKSWKVSVLSRRRALLKKEKEAELDKKRLERLHLLDSLSYAEKEVIAAALRANSMSTVVPVDSVGANLLRSKALGGFAGGLVDMEGAAFTIAPYVWNALQARKEEILSEVPEPSRTRRKR